MSTVDEMRALVGAVFCPTCEQDTLPLQSGICGFCDTKITKGRVRGPGRPLPPPEPVPAVAGRCEWCGAELGLVAPWNAERRRFCTDTCRKSWWRKYAAKGRKYAARHNEKRRAA